MGNVPLCVAQRDGVALGKYSNMPMPHPSSMRYLSESPDLRSPRQHCPRLAEEGREGGVGVWRRWSEDVMRDSVEGEGWEEGECQCDMILGLELFQDSVSSYAHYAVCLPTAKHAV